MYLGNQKKNDLEAIAQTESAGGHVGQNPGDEEWVHAREALGPEGHACVYDGLNTRQARHTHRYSWNRGPEMK